MKENKTQFFISDKPIDLQDIASNIEEPLEMPIDWEEATKPHTISFDCEVPKETADWFKEQMEEMNKESVKFTEHYMKSAIEMVENFIQTVGIFFKTPDKEIEDRAKIMLISYIFNAFCKGWNDCFDINVKREKKNI